MREGGIPPSIFFIIKEVAHEFKSMVAAEWGFEELGDE